MNIEQSINLTFYSEVKDGFQSYVDTLHPRGSRWTAWVSGVPILVDGCVDGLRLRWCHLFRALQLHSLKIALDLGRICLSVSLPHRKLVENSFDAGHPVLEGVEEVEEKVEAGPRVAIPEVLLTVHQQKKMCD